MKQAVLNLGLTLKKNRKREFLEQMGKVVPWAALVNLVAPYCPEGRTGQPPFSLQTKRRALDLNNAPDAINNQIEKIKAGMRAKVDHPFRVIKRQFGFIRVRYRGLKKNTAQLNTLFALSNLWMARCKLIGVQA